MPKMKTKRKKTQGVFLRFYEELNEFLPVEQKKKQFACSFEGRMTVSDVLKTLKIPASAVDLILANGESAGLSHVVRDNERLSFYPMFEAFDIATIQRVRRRPLRRVRFAVDPALEPLASSLRDLGFDTVLASDSDPATLAKKARKERRIFLTRSARKIGRGAFSHALRIRKLKLQQQLAEVLTRLHINLP
jgi:hypothetical protein